MNYSVNLLRRFTIHALDGELGKVVDFYFDDMSWQVRYLVVDTGSWLPGHRVLISAAQLGPWDEIHHSIAVALTQDQVRNSPDVDTAMPVSRQHEEELHCHYGWPFYWTGMMGLGSDYDYWTPPDPTLMKHLSLSGDPHLRSAREIEGYAVHAVDGDIGHVEDFIVEDDEWHIAYLVAKTRNWLPGRHVLLVPEWVERFDWDSSEVAIRQTCDEVRHSPELVT